MFNQPSALQPMLPGEPTPEALHREEYFKRTEENAGIAELIIAKQRNGPTGDVKLRFFAEYMRFENFTGRREPIA